MTVVQYLTREVLLMPYFSFSYLDLQPPTTVQEGRSSYVTVVSCGRERKEGVHSLAAQSYAFVPS